MMVVLWIIGLIGWYVFMSRMTYVAYSLDKRAFWRRHRRFSDRELHIIEFLGGWPGAIMAQETLNYKKSGFKFQFGCMSAATANIMILYYLLHGLLTGDWAPSRAFSWASIPFEVGLMTGIFFLLCAGACAWFWYSNPRQKGRRGEARVARQLRSELPAGYQIVSDVYLPLSDGTTTQIDQVVVSPTGIFVIEVKSFAGWIFGNEKSRVWCQTLYRSKHMFQNPLRQNYLHIKTLSVLLSIPEDYFQNVVVFAGDCEFKTSMASNVIKLVDASRHIRSFTKQVIKDSQVGEIVSAIGEWQGTISAQQKKDHVSNLRRRHSTVRVYRR